MVQGTVTNQYIYWRYSNSGNFEDNTNEHDKNERQVSAHELSGYTRKHVL